MYRSLGNDVTLAAPEYVSIGRTTGAMYSLTRYQRLNALSERLGAHKCYTIRRICEPKFNNAATDQLAAQWLHGNTEVWQHDRSTTTKFFIHSSTLVNKARHEQALLYGYGTYKTHKTPANLSLKPSSPLILWHHLDPCYFISWAAHTRFLKYI